MKRSERQRDLLAAVKERVIRGNADFAASRRHQEIAQEELERARGDTGLATERIALRLSQEISDAEAAELWRLSQVKLDLLTEGWRPKDPAHPDGEWVAPA